MKESKMLDSFEFKFLDTLKPIIDGEKIKTNNFRDHATELNENNSHAYWDLDFCTFEINAPIQSGVYTFFADDKLKYVGSAKNLSKRLKWYRKITISAIKRNGQPTNCHINNEIYKAINSGEEVTVYIHKTDKYTEAERRLRWLYKPEWNRQL